MPYRVVDTATGDLGGPAYRKFDLEAWMPGRGERRVRRSDQHLQLHRLPGPAAEHPLSQSRAKRAPQFVHTLNGTAIAISRGLIAILENYQQADGSIVVPEVLRAWVGKDRIEAESEVA